MNGGRLNWITNFVWDVADGDLRDFYVSSQYWRIILSMTNGLLIEIFGTASQ